MSRRRIPKIALQALVVPIVMFGLLEATLRIRQTLRFGAATLADHAKIDPVTGLPVFQPGEIRGRVTRIVIDEDGFRSPPLDHPKQASRIRLAFLGGSTTFCAEVSSNEATWPAIVERELSERFPEREFDFLNAAVPGYRLEHLQKRLEHHVAPQAPDVIVIYEATNDLSADT